jgi:hypothetical protein
LVRDLFLLVLLKEVQECVSSFLRFYEFELVVFILFRFLLLIGQKQVLKLCVENGQLSRIALDRVLGKKSNNLLQSVLSSSKVIDRGCCSWRDL